MDERTLEDLIKECDVDLYDTEVVVENDNKIYRVYITSKDGITLQKCTEVSRLISPILDLDPPVEGKYFLEVSSPGIERKLTKPRHFQKSVGELVKLKHKDLGKLKGKLLEADDKELVIEQKDGDKRVKYSDILSAKTYYNWN